MSDLESEIPIKLTDWNKNKFKISKKGIMRKIFIIIAAVWITTSVFAQPPEKISYQAVIRDASNNLVTNQVIGMQISILQGTANGSTVYSETQKPTTNANGLVSFEIGAGTAVSGDFFAIEWANGTYFIKTETDPTGGTSYTITGVSQLLSVPYALHAKTAETIRGTITETDPVFTESDAANITATDITNLKNLSGTNTGDQDLGAFATKTALSDSTAKLRSEIPDLNSFLSTETDPVWLADSSVVRAELKTEISDSLSTLNAKFLTIIQDTASQIRVDIPNVPAGTQTGDMQYWNGTAWVAVSAGTTGQLLSVNASGVPEWQNPSALKTAYTTLPEIDENGVVFTGVINANGYSSSIAFEYGIDTNYGNTITATASPVSSSNSETVSSAVITGLTLGVVYHVRMVVENIFGTFYSNDVQFTNLYYGVSYAGGLVFDFDNSGHGMVAAITDQSSISIWETAFTYCSDYSIGSYIDWYLPTMVELNLMYENLHLNGFGSFASYYYWSSVEYNSDYALEKFFGNGNQDQDDKESAASVRAVRAF